MDYKKLFDLSGKVAVVTGGTGYLGSENVKILKDFGATVVNADIAAAETRWNKDEEGAADMYEVLEEDAATKAERGAEE